MPDKLFYTVQENTKESLYILWVNEIITCAIYIEKTSTTNYISMVDSTGFNRGYNIDFIVHVIQELNGFILCFSYPKKELLFGESSKNELKRVLEGEKLFKLWSFCLEKRCKKRLDGGMLEIEERKESNESEREDNRNKGNGSIQYSSKYFKTTKDNKFTSHKKRIAICYSSSWSNFLQNRFYPFKNFNEIDYFSDSPISKMIEKFENLEDLFQGLLVRKDFSKGGLLFSNCGCLKEEKEEEELEGGCEGQEETKKEEVLNNEMFDGDIEIKKNDAGVENKKEKVLHNEMFDGDFDSKKTTSNEKSLNNFLFLKENAIYQSNCKKTIEFLRNSDFSTLQSALNASKELTKFTKKLIFIPNGMGKEFKNKKEIEIKVKTIITRVKKHKAV